LLKAEVTADVTAATLLALRFPGLIGGRGGDGDTAGVPAPEGAGGVAANAVPVTVQPGVDWPLDNDASCVAESATE
jgi:hypothetical protein